MGKLSVEDQKAFRDEFLKYHNLGFKTILILGDKACDLFKKIYTGDLYTIKTAEDVRNFKETQNFLSDKTLAFEDLSIMTKEVQASLLKFVEEPTRPLVVLCSKDNISDAMMSRFTVYIKQVYPIKQKPMTLKQFSKLRESALNKQYTSKFDEVEYTPEEELILTDLLLACRTYCPLYWYWYQYIRTYSPFISNPDSYIQFLEE